MVYSTVIASINNIWLKNVSSYNQLSKSNGSVIFTANQTLNTLCFDSDCYISDQSRYGYSGPCIDNVTIIEYAAQPSSTNTTNLTNVSTSLNNSQ